MECKCFSFSLLSKSQLGEDQCYIVIVLFLFCPRILIIYVQVAYFVGVQIEEECKNKERHGLSPEMRQLSTVGAVKVAVRSLLMAAGSSKS